MLASINAVDVCRRKPSLRCHTAVLYPMTAIERRLASNHVPCRGQMACCYRLLQQG